MFDIDLSDATNEQIAFGIDQLEAIEHLAHALKLHYIAEFDRRHANLEDGMSAGWDWLAYRQGRDPRGAREEIALAYVLEELPEITKAYAEGRISRDKLKELATFVEPEEDAFWAAEAEVRPYRQVRDWARIARRVRREETAKAVDERNLHLWFDYATPSLGIKAEIAGADGATLKTALDHLAQSYGRGPDGEWEPLAKRRADALVELAKNYLSANGGSDNATVVIHCTPGDLADPDGTAKLELGPIVGAEIARRLSCDGLIETVLHGPDGGIVGIGRRARVVPPKLMRELRLRDDGCVICGNQDSLHAHHVVHWAVGGTTDLDNLVLLCWKCHRLVHDKYFTLARDQYGEPLLVRPDGTPVRRRQEPLRQKYRERILGPPVAVG